MDAKVLARQVGNSLLTWEWTKRLLYWIILSAGTMSELIFLLASLWVTINASVHGFVRLLISEQMTGRISEMATVAYVGLPECILALAIVTTLSHVRVWLYNKQDKAALTWAILYGLPTMVFLVLSFITIGSGMLSINFQLPDWMIITRGLAGYFYGLIALLYSQLGQPQEVHRLKAKDNLLAETVAALTRKYDTMLQSLQMQNAKLVEALNNQRQETDQVKQLLAATQNEKRTLQFATQKTEETALQAYSQELQQWAKSGAKTISITDLMRLSGISKRKIMGAIDKGKLQKHSRNPELLLTSTVIEWLKEVGASTQETERETNPVLRIVGD